MSVLRSGWFLAAVMVTLLTGFVNFERNARSTARAESPLKADKERKAAPEFELKDGDGKTVRLSDYKGKVVLLDFWATWCAPCREALPHMREIAKKFQGQPLVVLSVSLDEDEQKWKDFIVKNEMTWLQCRDGGFTGPISRMFGVQAIPHTFTIDADGVLQDERIGDASVEGKLKKLISRARELQVSQKPGQ